MKCYSSFLVRCWLIADSTLGERAVVDVQHIQSGGRTRVGSLAEAEGWMFEACRNSSKPEGAEREGAGETKDGD
jgi:hypothetical protein